MHPVILAPLAKIVESMRIRGLFAPLACRGRALQVLRQPFSSCEADSARAVLEADARQCLVGLAAGLDRGRRMLLDRGVFRHEPVAPFGQALADPLQGRLFFLAGGASAQICADLDQRGGIAGGGKVLAMSRMRAFSVPAKGRRIGGGEPVEGAQPLEIPRVSWIASCSPSGRSFERCEASCSCSRGDRLERVGEIFTGVNMIAHGGSSATGLMDRDWFE